MSRLSHNLVSQL